VPPIFGRATITLGIGPHSSLVLCQLLRQLEIDLLIDIQSSHFVDEFVLNAVRLGELTVFQQ